MARGKPVVLSTKTFTSRSEALAFFKEILSRYRPGDRVSTADGAHLESLLSRHTEFASKLGVGIDHFEVMTADYGTRCFWIVRTDGSREDFSYVHCVNQP